MTGLKRDPALIPLSHDHHRALLAALWLKKGMAAYPECDSRAESIALLWERELNEHFTEEEEILFPQASAGEVGAMVERAVAEHREMRSMVEKCAAGEAESDLPQAFAQLLERHIRFEERELFPAIQEELSAAKIAELGARISARREESGFGASCSTG